VLVTNVSNRLQPLIRYELSDCFVEQPPRPESGGYVRVTVDGRRDDELHFADGLVVHPLAIRTVLVKTPDVTEYQVRQTRDGVDVAVVARDRLDEHTLASRLAASLATAGLPSPRVTVQIVDPAAIERHPATGKTRRFIPLAG
jgi:phenylacetate-coenzyme A ligase PaaK-like adenylate-forming protein